MDLTLQSRNRDKVSCRHRRRALHPECSRIHRWQASLRRARFLPARRCACRDQFPAVRCNARACPDACMLIGVSDRTRRNEFARIRYGATSRAMLFIINITPPLNAGVVHVTGLMERHGNVIGRESPESRGILRTADGFHEEKFWSDRIANGARKSRQPAAPARSSWSTTNRHSCRLLLQATPLR